MMQLILFAQLIATHLSTLSKIGQILILNGDYIFMKCKSHGLRRFQNLVEDAK